MKSYCLSFSTKTYFGEGCVEKAITNEKKVFGHRTMIITTGNILEKLGYVEEIRAWLGVETFYYDKITANPDVKEIREAIQLGKENKITSVIGFGGGSAIDAAKAVAIGVVSEIDIEEYLVKRLELPENVLPIIAIPTTAGTGAELSKGAIISSREKKIKSGIRGEKVAPLIAIVDPRYTFSLPFNVTVESGFDVFTHAAESYCAKKANPFSEMLSEKAIKIVGDALPRLVHNLGDIEARKKMSFASHIMGYNVRDVGNCLPHRLQYPLGVETETSHGAGLIALYPTWIKYESEVNEEKVGQILDWLGCVKGKPYERMETWLNSLNINRSILDLGNTLSAEELASMVNGNINNDKLASEKDIIIKIYEESM